MIPGEHDVWKGWKYFGYALLVIITVLCVCELYFLVHIVKKNKEAIKERFNIVAMYFIITLILVSTILNLWVDPIFIAA